MAGIGAINFQSKKTGNPLLLSDVFSLQKKRKNFFISIFINYAIWLTVLWKFVFQSCKVFHPEPF